MDYLSLPQRTKKPRKNGLTSIHDVSLSIGELNSILADYHEYLDIAKLGVGSAYVTPKLREKINTYKEFGARVYFGGTLFEKFYHQKKLKEYALFMKEMEIDLLEVSTGTLDIPLAERLESIQFFLDKGFTVLSEVGSKDSELVMAPSIWIDEIHQLLEIGCEYVITEGRNSGTAGVYRPSGELRTGLIDDLIKTFDCDKLIFEAPQPKAQMFFINKVGTSVNLGNVNPRDLLLLESQRLGLRSETFFIS